MTSFELLEVDGADHLGEGPWWDAATDVLWWVDIIGRRIRRATLDGREAEPIRTPSEVGFAVPRAESGFVAGLSGSLASAEVPGRGEPAEWATLWTGPWDPGAVRINDGKTDPFGRVWFGTMDRAEVHPVGRLFRWDGSAVTGHVDGVWVSNGLGWSPDATTMYYADSPARTIWAFDYDPATGDATGRRIFAEETGAGVPDGLTVDAEGFVWSAKWDGSRIVRYAPDGRVAGEVPLPVAKPTSVMFAGPGLGTLVVTSARMRPGDGDLAGRVFLVDAGVAGRPEARAR